MPRNTSSDSTKYTKEEAQEYIASNCVNDSKFSAILYRFIQKGIKLKKGEAADLVIYAVNQIIKNKIYDSTQRYYALQLLNQGIQQNYIYFNDKVVSNLLEKLATIADHDRQSHSMDKGRTIWKKTLKNPDPEYSYKFYYLQMEGFLYWPSIVDNGTTAKKEFEKKLSELRKKSLTFPSEMEESKYIYLEFDMSSPGKDNKRHNHVNKNDDRPKHDHNHGHKEITNNDQEVLEQKIKLQEEYRTNIHESVLHSTDFPELYDWLASEYFENYNETKPMILTMIGDESNNKNLKPMKTLCRKEWLFAEEFEQWHHKHLENKVDYKSFKKWFEKMYHETFKHDETPAPIEEQKVVKRSKLSDKNLRKSDDHTFGGIDRHTERKHNEECQEEERMRKKEEEKKKRAEEKRRQKKEEEMQKLHDEEAEWECENHRIQEREREIEIEEERKRERNKTTKNDQERKDRERKLREKLLIDDHHHDHHHDHHRQDHHHHDDHHRYPHKPNRSPDKSSDPNELLKKYSEMVKSGFLNNQEVYGKHSSIHDSRMGANLIDANKVLHKEVNRLKVENNNFKHENEMLKKETERQIHLKEAFEKEVTHVRKSKLTVDHINNDYEEDMTSHKKRMQIQELENGDLKKETKRLGEQNKKIEENWISEKFMLEKDYDDERDSLLLRIKTLEKKAQSLETKYESIKKDYNDYCKSGSMSTQDQSYNRDNIEQTINTDYPGYKSRFAKDSTYMNTTGLDPYNHQIKQSTFSPYPNYSSNMVDSSFGQPMAVNTNNYSNLNQSGLGPTYQSKIGASNVSDYNNISQMPGYNNYSIIGQNNNTYKSSFNPTKQSNIYQGSNLNITHNDDNKSFLDAFNAKCDSLLKKQSINCV